MSRLLANIRRSLARDRHLPLAARLAKGGRYAAATASGPWHLRACDRVGARARTLGRPRVRNAGYIAVGDDVVLNSRWAPCELVTRPGGRLEIGSGVGINYGTLIAAATTVRVGDRVSIGPYSVIADDADAGPGAAAAPITIGDGAWLAGRVTLLPGATVGAGSVITAGSVVAGDIPPGVVAGGNPARVLRMLGTPDAVPAQPAEPAVAERAPEAPALAEHAPAELPPDFRGVILTDFTPGDLAARLRDPSEPGPRLAVEETPYGQVIPVLLAGPPAGAADFAVVWTRPEALSPAFQRTLAHDPAADAELEADVDALCDTVLRAAPAYRAVFVATWTYPRDARGLGPLDARPGGVAWALAVMNRRLMARLAGAPAVFALDAQRWLDAAGPLAGAAKGWYHGKVPFPREVFAEAARDLRGAMQGVAGAARKLLVLDLDHTLWGGVVGDSGWEHLRLGGHDPEGEAYVDFQRAVKRLTRRGVVLALASKNTEAVALEAIARHPAMVLRREDFVAWRINWDDKAKNVAELAAELRLGLQSVVFVDDNPAERARVREALPEVLVPEWPADPLRYPAALAALRCFDTPALSREDAERTRLYAAERARADALREASAGGAADVGALDAWLATLDIQVRAEPLGPATLPRAAQLLNKTNQMNLATRRLTEAELAAWAAEPGREVWALSVRDRFGDAGLTGVLGVAFREPPNAEPVCEVTDFVLSCRVMGRRVEEAMAHLAVRRARALGAARLEARLRPTAKNAPCRAFWDRSGFAVDGAPTDTDAPCYTWEPADAYPLPACVTLEVAFEGEPAEVTA